MISVGAGLAIAAGVVKSAEKIAQVLLNPTRSVKKAKAKAEVQKINQGMEISEIKHRAKKRILNQQIREQKNIEKIAKKALEQLPENISRDPVDSDWASIFIEKSKHVSNEEMQNLWAKILAGELNQPGTYTIKTLNILSSISQNDARLFQKLCNLIFLDGTIILSYANPVLLNEYSYRKKIENSLENYGISSDDISYLRELGLVSQELSIISLDMPHFFERNAKTFSIKHSKYQKAEFLTLKLTKIGNELFSITPNLFNIQYFTQLPDRLSTGGCKITVSETTL